MKRCHLYFFFLLMLLIPLRHHSLWDLQLLWETLTTLECITASKPEPCSSSFYLLTYLFLNNTRTVR